MTGGNGSMSLCETCGKELVYDSDNEIWKCPYECAPKYVLDNLDNFSPEQNIEPDLVPPPETISENQDEIFYDYSDLIELDNYIECDASQLSQMKLEAESIEHFSNLKTKYHVEWYSEISPLSTLFPILLKLEDNSLPDDNEIYWLISQQINYVAAYCYLLKYQFHRKQWDFIRACKFFRKANFPEIALNLKIDFTPKDIVVWTALMTTRGAAFRALLMLDEAEQCARQVLHYVANNFFAYNLLGAIYFQKNLFEEGFEYFRLAVLYGGEIKYHRSVIEQGIIDKLMDGERVAKYLLQIDPIKYSWARRHLVGQ